jgi:hypothetical protein
MGGGSSKKQNVPPSRVTEQDKAILVRYLLNLFDHFGLNHIFNYS